MLESSLGRSGLKISKIVLGCMQFGSSEWQGWLLDDKDALPLLAHAHGFGIRTWETVFYSNTRELTMELIYATGRCLFTWSPRGDCQPGAAKVLIM